MTLPVKGEIQQGVDCKGYGDEAKEVPWPWAEGVHDGAIGRFASEEPVVGTEEEIGDASDGGPQKG